MKIKKIIALILLALTMCIPSSHVSAEDYSAISISLVNQDPDPAIAGNIMDLRLGVENTGSTSANNFMLGLEPKYPFELVPGDDPVQNLGTINAY